MKSRRVGRFFVNEKLSKALNVKNWVIYRDPAFSLYAYNLKTEDEFSLTIFAANQITKMDMFLESVRNSIKENNR